MKKSALLACVLCAFTAGSFAQVSPAVQGAQRVAERDAAYAKAHPSAKVVKTATAKTVVHSKHKAKTKKPAAGKNVKPTPAS